MMGRDEGGTENKNGVGIKNGRWNKANVRGTKKGEDLLHMLFGEQPIGFSYIETCI